MASCLPCRSRLPCTVFVASLSGCLGSDRPRPRAPMPPRSGQWQWQNTLNSRRRARPLLLSCALHCMSLHAHVGAQGVAPCSTCLFQGTCYPASQVTQQDCLSSGKWNGGARRTATHPRPTAPLIAPPARSVRPGQRAGRGLTRATTAQSRLCRRPLRRRRQAARQRRIHSHSVQVSAGILGRRTRAPFQSFRITKRVPHGLTPRS